MAIGVDVNVTFGVDVNVTFGVDVSVAFGVDVSVAFGVDVSVAVELLRSGVDVLELETPLACQGSGVLVAPCWSAPAGKASVGLVGPAEAPLGPTESSNAMQATSKTTYFLVTHSLVP